MLVYYCNNIIAAYDTSRRPSRSLGSAGRRKRLFDGMANSSPTAIVNTVDNIINKNDFDLIDNSTVKLITNAYSVLPFGSKFFIK